MRIFIDGHVHFYDCFDRDIFFDSAWHNFQRAAERAGSPAEESRLVLLLAEGGRENRFVRERENRVPPETGGSGTWEQAVVQEPGLLLFRNREHPERTLYMAAGFQVVTLEKIEVLSLLCQQRIRNGLSLGETVAAVQRVGGLAVVPWGAGKWLGGRGALVRALLGDPSVFVRAGDNGGRPRWWPEPAVFRTATAVHGPLLSGSDPLPLPEEARRVGGFGVILTIAGSGHENFLQALRMELSNPDADIQAYGRLSSMTTFLIRQAQLRLGRRPERTGADDAA
jgi:hypothetical protein